MKKSKDFLWALRHEPKRIWLWWWMCRVPLVKCGTAVRDNMIGFEYTYAYDMPKGRLRIFRPRQKRKLAKLLATNSEANNKEK